MKFKFYTMNRWQLMSWFAWNFIFFCDAGSFSSFFSGQVLSIFYSRKKMLSLTLHKVEGCEHKFAVKWTVFSENNLSLKQVFVKMLVQTWDREVALLHWSLTTSYDVSSILCTLGILQERNNDLHTKCSHSRIKRRMWLFVDTIWC